MARKKTQEEFISEVIAVHGQRYGTSAVKYESYHEKVKVICQEHGTFKIRPAKLLIGQGCPACAAIVRADALRHTFDRVVEDLVAIHGDRYTYPLQEYTCDDAPFEVVCQVHGLFVTTAGRLKSGCGCSKCGFISNAEKQIKCFDTLCREIKEIHGDKYTLLEETYKGVRRKVSVICDEHGLFNIVPYSLQAGKGCPCCAKTGFDVSTPAVLYLVSCGSIQGEFAGYGITKDLKVRFQTHRKNLRHQAFTITQQQVYHFHLGSYAKELEDMLYAEYPEPSSIGSSVPGFKRESTDTPFAQVKEFIEQKIKENSQRWGLLE